MSRELDLEFRSAVFAHVRRLADENGGVVTYSQLREGLFFRGERQSFFNRGYGIFKPAFLKDPCAAVSIQTSVDGPYDDSHDPSDDRFTYKYQGTDPNNHFNRSLRRAMEFQLPIVYFVGVKPNLYEPILPCYVIGDDPATLTFFLVADVEQLVATPATSAADNWPRKAYITRQVKIRLHQDRFKYMVLGAYREQCAMCRLRHVSLLEAAHIIPDRDVRGMPEVPNGLSLCRIHHGAFDVGIAGVDPQYKIHIREDVLEEHDGPMLKHGLQELHGSSIIVPSRAVDRPKQEYLEERFAKFRAA
jgi:putative restriction endonuclease